MRHALGIFCLVWLIAAAAQAEPAVRSVDHVVIPVSDAGRAAKFYETALSFEADEGVAAPGVVLRLGSETIELHPAGGRAYPADSRSNDRWFQHVAIIVSDMDRAFAWLRDHHVTFASSGPQVLPASNKQAAGIAAFYFRDPDGHYLEVLHFPDDKGSPKWHEPRGRLFLGIDHTAIVVADTDASLKFYRDTLGFAIAGTSENYGTEQEHLNNVFGARLRITTLRAAGGPGVELLEYLTPHDGRAMPPDTQANDVWRWQINLSGEITAVEREARTKHYRMISPGIIADDTRKTTRIMIADPDGHSSLLESAVQRKLAQAIWMNVDPELESLRPDPRFQALVKRAKLVE